MSFFRSEEMSLCQMLLHKESAFDCLAELGSLGVVQFNNLANGKHVENLKYSSEVQRCCELQRILQHLQTEINECEIKMGDYPLLGWNGEQEEEDEDDRLPQAKHLNGIELILQELELELRNVEQNHEGLRHQKNVLLEKWHVLSKADEFLQGGRKAGRMLAWSESLMTSLLNDEIHATERDQLLRLSYLAGAVPVERFQGFELMLWRVCRGNILMRHSEIVVPLEDIGRDKGLVKKHAFIVFFQGDALRQKIFKVCQGFRASLIECPESREERTFRRKILAKEFEDLKIVLQQTSDHRKHLLRIAAADFYAWREKLQKIMMIYCVLNKLSAVEQLNNEKYLQTDCWIPSTDIPLVRSALHKGAVRAAHGDASMMFPPMLTERMDCDVREAPPTYFRLNRFTRGFQNLINSYGVATYRELNPAPYTIVTFPFLFAVMFGDIGHGLIMAIFGMWLVLKEDKLARKRTVENRSNEIWNLLFAGRYIIMLMGVFSIYTGFIYNDIFSKSFNFLGSQWRVNYVKSTVASAKQLQLDPALPKFYLGTPYIFGMDPVWDASGENAIITYNSLKMKLAIILGVCQMMFGLSLSACNHFYARNCVDLLLVCLPQLLFLMCLFLYLVFLIFYKWLTFGGHHGNSACAPSILITFIDMVLMNGPADAPKECDRFMFAGQEMLQNILMITALLCIPVLLVGKPLFFTLRRNKRNPTLAPDEEALIEMKRPQVAAVRSVLAYNVEPIEVEIKQKDVKISELWIHQGIHCIESVLGSVSHTASYLRLWALSLAHDQLSTVLWNMILAQPLKTGNSWLNGVFLYFAFWVWAVLTLAILVVMEGLSAFLHTLRLHWVEFQSKFYEGAGEQFNPFRFENLD